MANLQAQATRVLFLDGQAIILQNEAGDNAFGDLNAELLQQALQSVGVTQSVDDGGADTAVAADASFVVPTNEATAVEVAEALPTTLEAGGASNFRLIFQNDEESQGAVRFMTEDAEALGLKIFVDGSEVKHEQHQHAQQDVQTNSLTVSENQEQHSDHEQQQVVFTTPSGEVATVVPSFEGCEIKEDDGTTTQFQSAADALGALVGATTAGETVSMDHPVTLVPQLIDGCVSYAVQFANGEDESADVGSTEQQEATMETSCAFSSPTEFAVSVTTAPETNQEQLPPLPVLSCVREHKSLPIAAKTQVTSRPHVPARKIVPAQSTPGSGPNRIKVHVVGGKVVTEPEAQQLVTRTAPNVARIAANNFDSAKPLGSSENPIQLVQHGQTFHSVQALTQEQLKQIATVLQQQHLDSAPRTKNVVYDAETNTRIIYRVVYPEDLDLCEPNSPPSGDTAPRRLQGIGVSHSVQGNITLSKAIVDNGRLQQVTALRGRGSGRRGRLPGSRNKRPADSAGLGEIRVIHDEAEEAARSERKKQLLSRTRSGRLSRPPRHMVKDYKRLHRLDFADADLDDSDGGYSDYQMSDHEDGKEGEGAGALAKGGTEVPDPALPAGAPTVTVPKRKISPHFRCPACQKIYLGHSRMARHLQAFPEHAKSVPVDEATSPAPPTDDRGGAQDKTGVSAAAPTAAAATPPTPASAPAPAPAPATATATAPSPAATPVPAVPNGAVPTVVRRVGAPPGPRKKKRRGPWAYITPEARSQRRKEKLREMLVTCEPVEVAEVCGRTVCGSLSLLELLWLRLEAVHANRLLEELAALVGEARTLLGSALTKDESDDKMGSSLDDEHVEVCGDVLCVAMGLECGRYRVDTSKLRPPPHPEEPPPSNPAPESNAPSRASENLQSATEVEDAVPGEPREKKPRIEDLKLEAASTSPDSGSSSVGMDCSMAGTPSETMVVDDPGELRGDKEVADDDTHELRLCPLEALGLQAQTNTLEAVRTPDSGVANTKEDSSPASTEAPHTPTELPHVVVELPVTSSELLNTQAEAPHMMTELQNVQVEPPGTPGELPQMPCTVTEVPVPHPPHDDALPQPPPELSVSRMPEDLPHTPTQLSSTPPEPPPVQREEAPMPAGQLHHNTTHPLDEDLLDGLCCSAEGHPDVAGSEEDAGRRAALQAVDDIVRERLGLVDFLDVIPPPHPSGRVELPGFASLQVPHRAGSGSGISTAPPPTFLALPDLSDHIDLDALGEELSSSAHPASAASGGEVVGS
ncbi:uncharacterized protein LOC124717146 isoform X1 [Schistocerca piceifrons]|uniref:uncharacterized protein LOC124717146 isoform X1 n=1 Tax=Schistocerca piceifrons TaxID=274613 RepID=UPI001F5FB136|nr:uncharacterized protein LOC124717146 isoform X1 [Schistocerca piceifrons]